MIRKLGPVLFWLLLLVAWQLIAAENGPNSLFPPPLSIITAAITDHTLLFRHFFHTLSMAAIGLGLGIALALLLAVFFDFFPITRSYLWPLLSLSQTMPPFLIYPLLIIILDFGNTPRIILTALVCFFPLVVNLVQGLSANDQDGEELFTGMAATPLQRFLYLRLPRSLPLLLGGLKTATAYSIIAMVFSEMMGGPLEGIGYYLQRKLDTFQTSAVYAAVALISLSTILIIKSIEKFETGLISHQTQRSTP